MSATAEVHAAAPRLERPHRGRAIAGVCAGLGRHLNIDPVLVRIAFVVLAALGGAGFVAYVAGVLLIPEEGERRAMIQMLPGRRIATAGGIVLLVIGAAATVGAMVGNGVGHDIAWSIVLLGLGGWLVLRPYDGIGSSRDTAPVTAETTVLEPHRRRHATRVVAGCMLLAAGTVTAIAATDSGLGGQEIVGIAVVVAGIALVVGAFFGASTWLVLPPLAVAAAVGVLAAAGVALRGPIGDREFHPVAATDLPGTYRLAIGEARLDLSDLPVPAGTTTVKLRVGIGEARVTVPAGVAVRIKAHAGAGDLRLPSGRSSGTDVDRTQSLPGPSGSTLVLDARVGLGDIRVERAGAR